MPKYEIMWTTEKEDGYVIVESPTPYKACMDLLREIILENSYDLTGVNIPTFYIVNILSNSIGDKEELKVSSADLIYLMYLSNNCSLDDEEEDKEFAVF